MNQADKQKLIEYLRHFSTEERYNRIQGIAGKRTRHFSVVVENLYQSHNISAILRTAECLGIQEIHIIENNFQYEISEQVSLGSHKWLSIHQHNEQKTNTIQCLEMVKKQGYKIIATLPHENDCLLDEISIDEKTAFVFGTELDGLTQEAIAMADGFVKIPMYGFTESYNVSVSVALTMMNVCERLRKSELNWRLSEEERIDLELQWLKKSIKDVDRIIERYGTV
jgi:tRNA (guanosine-2'-O-)-methyltransferase